MSTDNLELDLKKIEGLGKFRERENIRFRTYLKGKNSNRIDKIVHRLNFEISEQIDCTKCGNCCKKLKPSLNKKDIVRISGRINFSSEIVKEKYIEVSNGEQLFKNLPCCFLHENKCTIFIEEKCMERLLTLIQSNSKNITFVDCYVKYLKDLYPKEIISLYAEAIKSHAKVTDRKIYEEVANYLKNLSKINGSENTLSQLLNYFRGLYRNRKAMMEILNKNFPDQKIK